MRLPGRRPVQVQYSLTPAGAELMRVLRPLVDWAHRWDTQAAKTVVVPADSL